MRTHAQKLLLRQQKEQAGVMQASQNGRDLPPLPTSMPSSAPGISSDVLGMLPTEGGGDSGALMGKLTDDADASESANPVGDPD